MDFLNNCDDLQKKKNIYIKALQLYSSWDSHILRTAMNSLDINRINRRMLKVNTTDNYIYVIASCNLLKDIRPYSTKNKHWPVKLSIYRHIKHFYIPQWGSP